ncbi:YncE family protein [Chitinophaga vietnamensis]|uniref:YncE family protein n=1 Tax=Chitinophaga vietnamensis TaxID=2593957 RepID=UPI001178974A|nr:YncE family protein [Chitinophaga vietnamensis]
MHLRNFAISTMMCIISGASCPVFSCHEAVDTTHLEKEVLTLSDKIPLSAVKGSIDHMAFDEAHHLVFVCALGNNTVEVIDILSKKQVHTITGLHEPQGVLYIPSLQRLVVANGGDGSCIFYDATNYNEIKRLPLKSDADNIRYDPGANMVYVGYGDGAISVIDPIQMKINASIHLDGHPESFQLDNGKKRLYVNVPDAGKLQVVDLSKSKVVANWTNAGASSNFPMTFDKSNNRLFIGYRHPATIRVINTETGKEIKSFHCVGDTDDVFYDADNNLLFVSGGEGFIDVFRKRQEDYELINHIPTRKGARTSLWLPAQKMLLLAVPANGGNEAALWVYRKNG